MIEIVGVVKDAKYDNLRQETPRLAYQPVMQYGGGPNVVQIRGAEAGLRAARDAIREVNPSIRVISFEPVTAAIHRTLALDLLVSWLAGGFGAVGLLLTAVGLYGILSYTVARRTSELGIRVALGAGRAAILRMVMKEALLLVAIGVAAGLASAIAFSHVLTKLLFGVQPRDAVTFTAAGVVLFLVAVAASYWPARRATAVEPVSALRYE
jgi:predicted lysophospholipase L1 biosynthesis ABC-type transport system permease subunit